MQTGLGRFVGFRDLFLHIEKECSVINYLMDVDVACCSELVKAGVDLAVNYSPHISALETSRDVKIEVLAVAIHFLLKRSDPWPYLSVKESANIFEDLAVAFGRALVPINQLVSCAVYIKETNLDHAILFGRGNFDEINGLNGD